MFADPLAALSVHRSDVAEAERRAALLRTVSERTPGASPALEPTACRRGRRTARRVAPPSADGSA
ncbi:hypothetical protein [Microbacterium gilvum]|uniref:Uncharacterized protein n=1 Tax=Microbacterium gilvum TaxID=1336204 RepID=A0ABP8ZTP3_9MICO